MKITIEYNTNEQLWTMEKIATENGYEKTGDCYWCQLFTNADGDTICTSREDIPNNNAVEEFRFAVNPAKEAKEAPEKPARKEYTYSEGHHHEVTTSASTAMKWHRMGRRVTVWGYLPDGSQYHVTIPGAKQPERNADDENRAHCKHIANELESYAEGHVYRCPECGEEIRMPDSVGDKYRCPHCHNVADVEDYEQLSVYDFLSDVYDIEYRIGGDGEYRSVKIMVACGGPNIYIDTAEAAVKLYWWSDRAEYLISYAARDAVNEWAEELWGCR